MQRVRTWPFRFEIIDGLRGLAALAVVLTHLRVLDASVGHFAVMLFFIISGYCIAASVETCRHNGVSFRSFMWRRLHRIYPPYFFAIVFFVVTRLAKAASGGHNDLVRPWLDWVQNLTLTQWVSLPWHPVADAPQNPRLLVAAFWSLNYEDQFYLVMAVALLLAVRRRVPAWTTVLSLAAVGLFWNCLRPGGWITGLFIEYWVHFALGAMLFYALCLCGSRLPRVLFVAAVCALGGWCLSRILPWEPGLLLQQRAYAELAAACGFTLLLYCFRPISNALSRLVLWRPVAALGTISYSLYLVNQFNLKVVESTAGRLAGGAWEPLRVAIMVALQVSIASVFWYLCERPFLNGSKRVTRSTEVRLHPPTSTVLPRS